MLRLSASLLAVATLSACGPAATSPVTTSASTTTTPMTTTPTGAVTTPTPHQQKWTDLAVGECLAELPPVDLSALTVPVVDCTAPHAAEVYLRAPVEVNAALADIADQKCAAGLLAYSGHPVGGAYAMTYLIDSDQNRTSSNPEPSTVICLLQAASGGALTTSAHS